MKFDRGTFLKEMRIERDLTLDDVGSKIGVTKQTLYKYENNIVTNIPSDKIEALAKLYNVSPAKIMGWQQETDSELTQKDEREIESDLEDMMNSISSAAYNGDDGIEDMEAFKATIKAAMIQAKKIAKKKYTPKKYRKDK